MWRLKVITSWTEKRSIDLERVVKGCPYRISDYTGQPAENISPNPNLFIVDVLTDTAGYKAILDHADYGEGSILAAEEEIGYGKPN